MIAEEVLRYGKVKVAAEVFTFRELAAATDNFNADLLVGEGGFGRVYRGQLKTTKQVHIHIYYIMLYCILVSKFHLPPNIVVIYRKGYILCD